MINKKEINAGILIIEMRSYLDITKDINTITIATWLNSLVLVQRSSYSYNESNYYHSQ